MLLLREEVEYCKEKHTCFYVSDELGKSHPNGRHHKECQRGIYLSSLHFDFLNRMDEEITIFQRKVFIGHYDMRTALNLTSDFWYECDDIARQMQFYIGNLKSSSKIIELDSGSSYKFSEIVRQLIMDLSFEGRKFFGNESCLPNHKEEWEKFENQLAKCGSQFYPEANITCQNDPTRCLLPSELCDGFPQCPNATDESLDNCKDKFPKLATFECTKDISNNFSIPILALRCNGIKECPNGKDEEGCDLGTIITYTVLLPGLVICLTASIVVVYKTNPQLVDANVFLDVMYHISCPNEKSRKLIEVQNVRSRKVHNRKYYNDILESANGDEAEALNEIKKNVGPSVTKNLLEDIDCSKSFFKTLKVSLFAWIEKIPLKIRIVISITLSLYSHFGDIVKDILMLITIGRLTQGGDFFLAWVSILAMTNTKYFQNMLISDLLLTGCLPCDSLLFGLCKSSCQPCNV